MGRSKSLGLLKSFLSDASQLSEGSILAFLYPWFISLVFSVHCREWLQPHGGSLMAAGRTQFFLDALWAQKFTFGEPGKLMAVTSLFIDMKGNTTLHNIYNILTWFPFILKYCETLKKIFSCFCIFRVSRAKKFRLKDKP